MQPPPTNGGPHLPFLLIAAGLAVAYLAVAVFTADRGRQAGQSSFSMGPSARRRTRRLLICLAISALGSGVFVLYRNHAYHAVTVASAVASHASSYRSYLVIVWAGLSVIGTAVLFTLASLAVRRRRPARQATSAHEAPPGYQLVPVGGRRGRGRR